MSFSLHAQTSDALNGIPEAKQRIKQAELEISALEGVVAARRSRLEGMKYDLSVKQQHIERQQKPLPVVIPDSSDDEKPVVRIATKQNRRRRYIDDSSEDESAALRSPPPAPRCAPLPSPMQASPVEMPPTALASAAAAAPSKCKGNNEKLTAEQKARNNTEYAVGDLVRVEYTTVDDNLEHIEFAEVKSMGPLPHSTRSGREVFRLMTINWVYDYKSLVDELGEETLAGLDFMEGDYAYSDHDQEVNVYNCIGQCNDKRELIEFEFDGENLRKLKNQYDHTKPGEKRGEEDSDEEEYAPPQDENELVQEFIPKKKQKLDKPVQLPRHEFIVMQFLQSYKLWTDTKYGRDLYFVINSLMTMGHQSNFEAREKLIHMFFEENMEPKGNVLEWEEIEATHEQCDACGIARHLKWRMNSSMLDDDEAWQVGSHCKNRIEALSRLCSYVAMCRKEAKEKEGKAFKPYKMAKVVRELNEIRSQAQEAIAGPKLWPRFK